MMATSSLSPRIKCSLTSPAELEFRDKSLIPGSGGLIALETLFLSGRRLVFFTFSLFLCFLDVTFIHWFGFVGSSSLSKTEAFKALLPVLVLLFKFSFSFSFSCFLGFFLEFWSFLSFIFA